MCKISGATVILVLIMIPLFAQQPNPVVVENQHSGTTSWRLTKVKTDTCSISETFVETTFCRQKEIEGYTSHTSIQTGEELMVYVSTEPADSFTLDIFRMGYYQGKGGRLMQTLGPFAGRPQATPKDGEKNLIECMWKPSLSFEIPNDWVSGVYLGKLTTTTAGWQSHIVFMVRDDRNADFIFQCSDLTWQSYNRWPAWRSLYDWEADWGYTPWFTRPGPEVGFDRPYSFYMNHLPAKLIPEVNGSGEFLLWEFPLAFWMESEGYDVTYISNIDTHKDPEGLLRCKGFLSVGHDEYWTREMYEHVTQARDRGVNLLFLSGNSLSGEIYLKPSTEGKPERVFGRKQFFPDEEWLMGSKSYGVGLAGWICKKPGHWLFDNTGMQLNDTIPDLVGWEYHGYPLPDIRGLQVIAEGEVSAAEEANMYASTYYETESGSFVFNAATCWWSMLLSTPPGFAYPQNYRKLFTGHAIDFRENDPRVQTITRNLLDRATANHKE